MKRKLPIKILFLLISILVIETSSQLIAQNVSPKSWSYGVKVNTDYPYFGIATATDGSVYVAGGGDAANQNFTIKKFNSNGLLIFTKAYVSRNKGKGTLKLDSNGDVFVMSTFTDELRLTNDTFVVGNTTSKHSFFGKFSGSTGIDIWVKSMPVESPVYSELLTNNNFLIAYSAPAGPFMFDGNVLTTLTIASTVFMELSNADGSVINHWAVPNTLLSDVQIMAYKNSNLIILDFANPPVWVGGNSYLRKSLYNLNNGTYIKRDSLVFRNLSTNSGRTIKNLPLCYNHDNGDIYLSFASGSYNYLFGNDTIKTNENVLFRLDSNLNTNNLIRMAYPTEMIRLRDTNLVLGTRSYTNQNYVWMMNDTINLYNNQWSYLITHSNLNFQHRKHAFMATNSWQTGLELRDIAISKLSEVFVLGFHENDIIFPPNVVPALRRSWKHLSAYGKMDLGLSVGLNEFKNKNEVINAYPNPFKNQLTIEEEGEYEYSIFTIDGRLVLNGKGYGNTIISTEELKSAIYLLKVQSDSILKSVKIIK